MMGEKMQERTMVMKVLSSSIEEMRNQLVELAGARGFQDQQVILLSQRLDVLIVDYLSRGHQKENPFLARAI